MDIIFGVLESKISELHDKEVFSCVMNTQLFIYESCLNSVTNESVDYFRVDNFQQNSDPFPRTQLFVMECSYLDYCYELLKSRYSQISKNSKGNVSQIVSSCFRYRVNFQTTRVL